MCMNIGPYRVFFWSNLEISLQSHSQKLPHTGKGLSARLNTKKVVSKSDIAYFSTISTVFDGGWLDLDYCFVKKVRVFIQINENPSKSPEIGRKSDQNRSRSSRYIRYRISGPCFSCFSGACGFSYVFWGQSSRYLHKCPSKTFFSALQWYIDTHLGERTCKCFWEIKDRSFELSVTLVMYTWYQKYQY